MKPDRGTNVSRDTSTKKIVIDNEPLHPILVEHSYSTVINVNNVNESGDKVNIKLLALANISLPKKRVDLQSKQRSLKCFTAKFEFLLHFSRNWPMFFDLLRFYLLINLL